MLYNKEQKYVFLAIPKTGTRSIYKVLKGNYNAVMYKEHHKQVPEEFKDFYTFTVVRNPYDRFISMWWSTCQRDYSSLSKLPAGGNFKRLAGGDSINHLLDWMLKIDLSTELKGSELLSRQSEYLINNDIDLILHTENLNNEFKNVNFIKNDSLGNSNSSKKVWGHNLKIRNKDPFYYINQESLEKINEYYKDDFKILKEYSKINKL